MIASAIKNGLILVLIIFIFHFFLKNHLYDQEMEDDDDNKEGYENVNAAGNSDGKKEVESTSKPTRYSPSKLNDECQGSLLSSHDIDKGMKHVKFQHPKPVEDANLFNPMKDDDLFQFILDGEKKVKNDCEMDMLPKTTDVTSSQEHSSEETNFSKPFDKFFQKTSNNVEPANDEGPASLDELFKATQVSPCP